MRKQWKQNNPNDWFTSTLKGETWKPVAGDLQGWPYWVSDDGRVYSPRTETILQPYSNQVREYKIVDLRYRGERAQRSVHSLVLEAFVGPRPDGHQAHHLDGDDTNNTLANLEYVDASKNAQGGSPLTGELEDGEFAPVEEAPF